MSTFNRFILHQEYASIAELGDKLGEIADLIEWDKFRAIIANIYFDNDIEGGRPHTDEIILLKMLILQQWYGLSDYELEKQALDRISFRNFLGYPKKVPDRSTIWRFKDRLSERGALESIWTELQNQLENQGLIIKRGVIQDASFITSDPGHASSDKPRGDDAKTRRSRDGTWAKKGSKSNFGYKLHILMDKDDQLIRRLETTTASVHDNQIDLSRQGETVYRDKGYFGVKSHASMNKTMKRAVRGSSLSIKDKRRNKAISRVRSQVERPFAVIKRVFHSGHLLVTTRAKIHVQNVFSCFAYNLNQLLTIHRSVL